MRLENKKAIITGAASGFASACWDAVWSRWLCERGSEQRGGVEDEGDRQGQRPAGGLHGRAPAE